jgi:hypothetical protein
MSTAEITKWQAVGALRGASPGEMAGSIASVRNAISDLRNGRPTEMQKFSYMTAQSGQGPFVDIRPETDPTEFMISVSRWLEAQKKKGPAAFAAGNRAVSSMLGFGQGTINALDMGPDELRKQLKAMEKYAPSEAQTKKFQDLQAAMARAATAAESLGRLLVERLAGPLTTLFEVITKIVDKISFFLGHENEQKTQEFIDKHMPEASGGPTSIFGRVKSWIKRKTGIGGSDEGAGSQPGGVGGGTATQGGAANDNAVTGPGSSGAPGSVGRHGWWTPERKQYAVDYLMKNANLPEVSARAMVARWAGVEAQGGPSEVNSIGATGIGQWLGNRKRGVVVGDFEGQLAHAVRELKGPEARAYRTLMGARDARAAATGASMFERAEGYNPNTGTDNFTGKTMNFMRYIPGGSANAIGHDAAAREAGQGATTGTFDSLWNSRIGNLGGARSAMRSGGGVVNNNQRSNETHIDNMTVTVPPGADPAGYARGISQELQRYDNVMKSNEGLL